MKKSVINLTIAGIALTSVVSYVVIKRLKGKNTKRVEMITRDYTKIGEFHYENSDDNSIVKVKAI